MFGAKHDIYFFRSSILSKRKYYGHCWGNKSNAYNTTSVHWNDADANLIWPSLKEPLDITDSLDVVVGEGVWYFLIITFLLSYVGMCLPLLPELSGD